MHEQGANSRTLRDGKRALYGILKHGAAELMAMETLIDRQTSKHHHGHRIWHVPADASGCFLMSHCASSHRVIRDDLI